MNKETYFMPLGGGQRVGASCYFLKLGSSNIILDAGIGLEERLVFEPDLYALQSSPLLNSMNQVSQIFVSHAHADHIGYLLKLMKQAPHASVYMTELTAVLTKYQLYDKNFILNAKHTEEEARLAAQYLLDKVVVVNYMQTMDFGEYKVTFYPAGHIPGAMMMLFEYGRRKILYTGDFSLGETLLTDGCYIPEDMDIDTVIMCGLHAKHPGYIQDVNSFTRSIDDIFRTTVVKKKPVMCHVSQLSKGIELLKGLENVWNVPVYIDKSLMHLVEKLERLSVRLMTPDVHLLPKISSQRTVPQRTSSQRISPQGTSLHPTLPQRPHIVITSCNKMNLRSDYEDEYVHKWVDFSLHEDFPQMKQFIKRINPKNVYFVHCAKSYNEQDETVEQEIMRDADCRTQFLFAEEQEIYQL